MIDDEVIIYSIDDASIDAAVSCTNSKDIKYCKYCGKPFVASGRNASRMNKCSRHHYSRCVICGEEVSQDSAIKQNSNPVKTCKNPKCRNTYSGMKSKQAIQEKYGVDNPFQLDSVKTKSKKTIQDKYGVDYISQSKEIQSKIKASYTPDKKQTANMRRIATNLAKYGVENPTQSAEIQQKRQEHMQELYGVDHHSQLPQFKDKLTQAWESKSEAEIKAITDKRCSTNLDRYGVEYNSQSDSFKTSVKETWANKSTEELVDINNRRKSTSMSKYGVISPSQLDEVKHKCVVTNLNKYGVEHPMQLQSFKYKVRSTSLDKYGTEYPTQSDIIKQKRVNTSLLRYGVTHPNKSIEVQKHISLGRVMSRANSIEDPILRQNYIEFATNPVEYVRSHFDATPTYKEVQDSVGGINDSSIYMRLPLDSNLIARNQSTMERDIENFLYQIDDSIQIIKHSRSIISPYEVDLYLPQYKLGIECNPTYTHNSTLPSYQNTEPLDRLYHKIKTDLSAENNIFLFHIFGYEWKYKQDIIKSMLRHLLGKDLNKYYGRNLQIVELSSVESTEFFNSNHRQGYAQSSIRLGLKTANGALVSAMTFSKMRNSIGYNKSVTSNTYELTRFCNKLNTSVIGGASKLFNYFLENYNFDTIVSFSDRAHTKGNLYSILGFNDVSISEPGYVWVSSQNDSYYHRVTCQKQNLPNLFHEPDLDIKNQTEIQIMASHGFVQVFDSGVIRWEYAHNEDLR